MKKQLFNLKYILYDIGRGFAFLHIFFILRPKYIYENGEKINRKLTGKTMIISNHTHWIDVPVLVSVFMKKRLIFVVAKEVYQNWIMRVTMNIAGCIKLDREIIDFGSIKTMIKTLNEGKPLVMFPEGKINDEPIDYTFKKGISLLAFQTKPMIIPIYISDYKFFRRLRIYIGVPIDTKGYVTKNLNRNTFEDFTTILEQKMMELRRMANV